MSQTVGKVYLVGAGPGSIAYLTVLAQQILTQAEVLVYDALVDEQLLTLVPPQCLRIDVGKRGGEVSTAQAEIDSLLVEHCQKGRLVVRLKSGDPFIFGRSASEISALKEAGCQVEVIPGISSALAAPLFAGIPLTDPVLSRCFAVMSAHEPDELHWEALAQLETLVLLMGTRHLAEIVHQLERHGRSPHTPVAIIRWAGQADQQIWIGTLADIVQKTSRQSLSPAVIVIGEVVNLRPFLWSDPAAQTVHPLPVPVPDGESPANPSASAQRPLIGKTVLVTRAAGQSSQFTEILQAEGATVIEMPTLEIQPPSSWTDLDAAIARLNQFDWLILTSANGVNFFLDRMAVLGNSTNVLADVKIAVVGKKTASVLQGHGIQPNFIPPDFVADSLIEAFPEPLAGLNVLFPRVESGGRDVLMQSFTAMGAVVTEVAAYQSGCTRTIAPEALTALQRGSIDVITFASSKTVRCFYQLVRPFLEAKTVAPINLAEVYIASIGPQTTETCRELLGRIDLEATEYTLEGLTQVIAQWAQQSI